MARTVYDVLQERLRSIKEGHERALLDGSCADFAAYRNQCGVIQGLATALREVQDLAKNQMDDDDD